MATEAIRTTLQAVCQAYQDDLGLSRRHCQDQTAPHKAYYFSMLAL
jgi:hypothetical protein